jgi:hypothetical protein
LAADKLPYFNVDLLSPLVLSRDVDSCEEELKKIYSENTTFSFHFLFIFGRLNRRQASVGRGQQEGKKPNRSLLTNLCKTTCPTTAKGRLIKLILAAALYYK